MLQAGIELQNNYTDVLYNVTGAVSLAISSIHDMQQALCADIDMSSMESARDSINRATMELERLNGAMEQVSLPSVPENVSPPSVPENVSPPSVPENSSPAQGDTQAQWQSGGLRVFTDTGMGRFRQEIADANQMLERLSITQSAIVLQALQTDILPQEAFLDLSEMADRINAIRNRIQQIENNPVDLGVDTANTELEQLREQLGRAVQQQESLNRAMQDMDVSAANEAYQDLSQTVGEAQRHIRDNMDGQGDFNQPAQGGTGGTGGLGLIRGIGNAVTSVAAMVSPMDVMNLSDQLTSTTARLNMMNDGLQSTEDLQRMIYASAERSRGSYQATANAVANLGFTAGDAFSGNEEIVGFVEQLNKQFTIAGMGASGVESTMSQLTQVMGSGALSGEDFNSILEQAPNIIQAIASHMGVTTEQLKSMADEGQVTADIVKQAMFAAADETDAKFAAMPMTFEQIRASLQNTAMMALQPLLENLNGIANSPAFQEVMANAAGAFAMLVEMANPIIEKLANSPALWGLANGLIQAFSLIGIIALWVVGLLVDGANMIAENWSWISPIVYGIIAALAAYLLIAGIVTIINGIHAASEAVKASAQAMATGATFLETAAQYGLNAALAACPLAWIILLIIALVAVIFAVCNAIAQMTGIANTGFGVITGGINVVIAFFKNLLLTVANIALGIWGAIRALANNMKVAFQNAISSIQSWFYSLLSTALTVIGKICEKLNRLPFVEFDYSGITSAAEDYAAKAEEAAKQKGEYQDIASAFNQGMSTFNAYQDGWLSDAFNEGAEWGDGIMDKISGVLEGLMDNNSDINPEDYLPDIGGEAAGGLDNSGAAGGLGNIAGDTGNIAGNTGNIAGDMGDIAGNTGAIKDSMNIAQEDLKYLRDIAEQEIVNRFTVAEVHIEQTNNNNVSSETDLDGIFGKLTDAVDEAAKTITEGVHD